LPEAKCPEKKMINKEQKLTIMRLRSLNWSFSDIAVAINRTESAVKKCWQREDIIKDLPVKPVISKSKIGGFLGLQIKKLVYSNPDITYGRIPGILSGLLKPGDWVPTESTIRLFLKKNGFIRVKKSCKPLLSDKNKQKRLSFALENVNNDQEFWDNMLWTDETTVRQMHSSQNDFSIVHESLNKDERPKKMTLQAGGFSVMFWGAMSSHGFGPLVEIEGNINAKKYVELLKSTLVPYIRRMESQGIDLWLMQDNASVHTAKLTRDFLDEKTIDFIDWPAQSPDLNPIENAWYVVKSRLKHYNSIPRNREELIQRVKKIWREMPLQFCVNYSRSVSKRLSEVIKKKGKQINY